MPSRVNGMLTMSNNVVHLSRCVVHIYALIDGGVLCVVCNVVVWCGVVWDVIRHKLFLEI